jgi:hypothetical protein
VEDIQAPAALRVEVRADGEEVAVRLVVSLAEDAPPGRLDETVRFTVRAGERRYPERVAVRAIILHASAPAAAQDGADD